ncbi:ABC transporter permease [Paracoccus sediminis]|uniref:Transport permease protein n=1 Tax=Paracoccus sediminis TaxID=1214787 RepID=A0A238Y6E1_9RHOB|nr:ABC transporter permease [Paracoccus sediminis]SNR66371.1 capsular polysaccharide transport system permease protein [Paracoccus sediminis]
MPRIVMALMLREMATTYGRSAGGYLWAILEPVLGIALLSVIFSLALARPGLGTNFPLFYASGLLPFLMFNDIANKVAGAIRFSRPFLAYPSVTFIDTLIARIVLNALTHTAIVAIVLVSIVMIYRLPVVFDLPALFEALLMVTMLAVGVGTLNCYLTTAFPVWERIWSILTRPLFLMSGIFFLYGMMPTQAQNILWYNPLVHCIGMMRQGIYPTYAGDYISPGYVVGVSVVLFVVGLMLLERNYRTLLER